MKHLARAHARPADRAEVFELLHPGQEPGGRLAHGLSLPAGGAVKRAGSEAVELCHAYSWALKGSSALMVFRISEITFTGGCVASISRNKFGP